MAVEWISDPINEVVRAFERLYPDKPCRVMIGPSEVEEGALGHTFFPDDGGIPEVCVHPDQQYAGVMDIMAHELAHVACGEDEGHGEKWQAAYRAIHDEYSAYVSRQGECTTVTVDAQ